MNVGATCQENYKKESRIEKARRVVRQYGSFTATGACLDNAYVESFFATLKKELVYQHAFATREEARKALLAYINVTYNRYRLHSSLGYQSPDAFETTSTSRPLALAA